MNTATIVRTDCSHDSDGTTRRAAGMEMISITLYGVLYRFPAHYSSTVVRLPLVLVGMDSCNPNPYFLRRRATDSRPYLRREREVAPGYRSVSPSYAVPPPFFPDDSVSYASNYVSPYHSDPVRADGRRGFYCSPFPDRFFLLSVSLVAQDVLPSAYQSSYSNDEFYPPYSIPHSSRARYQECYLLLPLNRRPANHLYIVDPSIMPDYYAPSDEYFLHPPYPDPVPMNPSPPEHLEPVATEEKKKPRSKAKDSSKKPDKHNFKTKLCTGFQSGYCKYGSLCKFAHGEAELRPLNRKAAK